MKTRVWVVLDEHGRKQGEDVSMALAWSKSAPRGVNWCKWADYCLECGWSVRAEEAE